MSKPSVSSVVTQYRKAVDVSPMQPEDGRSSHVVALDGLRGLAAGYVLLHHAFTLAVEKLPVGGTAKGVANLLNFSVMGYGHLAVDMFIVLSGLCLMTPVLRSDRGTWPGGAGRFLKRRSWRILPPYYAALAVSIAMVAAYSRLTSPFIEQVQTPVPTVEKAQAAELGAASVGSHLLLVHNWDERLIYTINPPLWSVAVEAQIYLLFILMLLPIWRRAGWWATLVVSFAVGLGPVWIRPFGKSFGWTFPWYVGLFALGMAAAGAAAPAAGREHFWGRRLGWLTAGSAVALAGLLAVQRESWAGVRLLRPVRVSTWGSYWPIDLVAGVTAALLLTWMVRTSAINTHQRSRAAGYVYGVLVSPIAVAFGAFSYSLYLIHYPVLYGTRTVLIWLGCGAWAVVAGSVGLGVPSALLTAWGLYVAVERPSIRVRR